MNLQIKPIRIQRKRTKGWKMPENTLSVTRPGKYGNIFKVGEILSYTRRITKVNKDSSISGRLYTGKLKVKNKKHSLQLYRDYAESKFDNGEWDKEEILKYDYIACWCALDKPCHVDILLELANE